MDGQLAHPPIDSVHFRSADVGMAKAKLFNIWAALFGFSSALRQPNIFSVTDIIRMIAAAGEPEHWRGSSS